MLIYICSPYTQGILTENVKNAREYSRRVVEEGNIPITPHIYFPQFVDEATERDKAMEMNKKLLSLCDKIYVYIRNGISSGMAQEIKWAKELGVEVIYK